MVRIDFIHWNKSKPPKKACTAPGITTKKYLTNQHHELQLTEIRKKFYYICNLDLKLQLHSGLTETLLHGYTWIKYVKHKYKKYIRLKYKQLLSFKENFSLMWNLLNTSWLSNKKQSYDGN